MKISLNIAILFLLAFILTCSKEEFPEIQLPKIIVTPPETIGLDSIRLSGKYIPGTEDFQIRAAGFKIVDGGFNDEWEGIEAQYSEEIIASLQRDGWFSKTIPYESQYFNKELAIAPYVIVHFAGEIQNRRLYGKERIFRPSAGINLSLIIPETRSKKTTILLHLSGLANRGLTFQDFGIIWVAHSEKPSPGYEFDLNTPDIREISLGLTDSNVVNLRLQPEFPWGQYVYVRPYAVYKEKRFLGEPHTLFIGDYWESIPEEGYASGLYPGQLYGTIGFSLNGKGYAFGGRKNTGDGNDPIQSTLWEYQPEAKEWRIAGILPTSESGEPGYRRDATAFKIENKAYIGLGRNVNSNAIYSSFFEFSPEDGFREVASYPYPAYRAASFVIGKKAYVGTGADPEGTSYHSFFSFDPHDDTETDANGLPMGKWKEVSAFPIAIEGAVGFTIGNKGYVGTGYTRQTNTLRQEFYEFDPSAWELGSWRAVAPFEGTPRQIAMAFVIGDKAYVGGGANFATGYFLADHKDFWEFDPGKNNWVRVEDIGLYPRSAAASFSIEDKGYVYGGYIQSGIITATSSMEIYIPDF